VSFFSTFVLMSPAIYYFSFSEVFPFIAALQEWFNAFFDSFASRPPGHYTRLGRIARIIRFLRRASKKRRNEKRRKKREKKQEKKKARRFKRRMLRRKLKVIFKAWFLGKQSTEQKQKKHEKKRLRAWQKRRKKRIRKVIWRSFFSRPHKSKSRRIQKQKKKQEKAFQRYRRRRMYRFILKRTLRVWFRFLSGKGLPPRRKKKNKSLFRELLSKEYMVIAFNSLLFFLLAYFLMAFIEKLGMAFTAMHFDYKTVLYYYRVEYLVDVDDWYADSIKAIFASGPLLSVIVATLLLILYSKVYLEDGMLKLLVLWSVFHGYNALLGGTFIGALSGKEFGYVIMYMYYSDTGKLVIALITILTMIILGSSSVKFWIFSANTYYNFSKTTKRTAFVVSQVFIPYLLGNALIYFINQPKQTSYHLLVNLSMLFMLLPVLLLARYQQEYYFDEKKKHIKLSWTTLVAAAVLVLLYRIGLDYGLRLG